MAKDSRSKISDILGSVGESYKSVIKVMDIDIGLIDFDEKNEYLNGYEDLEQLQSSIDQIGMKSVIGVYKKPDGRYLCYSGHSRILAEMNNGKKKLTCQVEKMPETEAEKNKMLVMMNTQRRKRPLYVARNMKELERIYRMEGTKGDVIEKVCKHFGIARKTFYRYYKILELREEYQELCKELDFPFTILVDNYDSLSEDQKTKLYELIKEKQNSEEKIISGVELKELIEELKLKDVPREKTAENKVYIDTYVNKMYKLSKENSFEIKNKKRTLQRALEAKEFIDRIIKECEE